MNEQKSLTLDEAKARIEQKREVAQHIYEQSYDSYFSGLDTGFDVAGSILARVEQPSENDMAVLWLIKEHGWAFRYRRSRSFWEQQLDPQFDDWVECNPSEEARKMGWGW